MVITYAISYCQCFQHGNNLYNDISSIYESHNTDVSTRALSDVKIYIYVPGPNVYSVFLKDLVVQTTLRLTAIHINWSRPLRSRLSNSANSLSIGFFLKTICWSRSQICFLKRPASVSIDSSNWRDIEELPLEHGLPGILIKPGILLSGVMRPSFVNCQQRSQAAQTTILQ